MEIRELREKDYNKVIEFAIVGMHFNWYMDNQLLLKLYGKYFWYMKLSRATQVIAAYIEDKLVGVLLADIKGEHKKYHSIWKSIYIKVFDILQNLFVKEGTGVYNEASRELFSQYCKNNLPEGEINFLAVNPRTKAKGIGSLLLSEFERREKGKKVYLYTDNACTYQFYEHRGFKRECEKNIVLKISNKKVKLKCFLYSKRIN